jgi:multiple antibiotic resistance protein
MSMMDTVIPFALLCFTSLFTITSPLSTMPVFLTMTQSLDEKERRAVAIRATLVACCALLLFVLAGQFLFKFFGISTNGFRIVGGIIIFRIGFDMLQAKYTPMNLRKEEIKEYANDVSVAPLGIPLLCGPGAIANAIVLMQEAYSFEMKTAVIVAIILVYLITFVLLRWAGVLVKFIGETGNNVMMRLMGLILMVIAVECFVSGARPILTEILRGS